MVLDIFKDKKKVLSLVASTFLICVNWFVFIYAVASGQTVEASLGYFINPILFVALGIFFFKEKLNPFQWMAVGFATLGILYQIYTLGSVSWISLVLPLSFGLYGLVRKKVQIGGTEGLFVETMLALPFSLLYLLVLGFSNKLSFSAGDISSTLLLIAAGPVTSIPLILYTEGVRRLPLSIIGLIQYVAPSLQLIMGVYVFGESFGMQKLISFSFIWIGLILLVISQTLNGFKGKKMAHNRVKTTTGLDV